MTRATAIRLFLAFAFTYFFSALLRAVTATLAPVFSTEMGLGASRLGLLAGAFFLGFSAAQLPLGTALDRLGPKRVLLGLLGIAVLGCAGFAAAANFEQLLGARLAIGVGVAACLMAPLTAFRRHYGAAAQLRANSWMLMTGSLGMLASTLPVHWLLPSVGWRGMFWMLGGLLLVAWIALWAMVPADAPPVQDLTAQDGGYRQIWRDPIFRQMAPLGFTLYGGMIALQTLWIGPWLTAVAGTDAHGAAKGLLWVNACMLVAFLAWGALMPRLRRRGWHASCVMAIGWPICTLVLFTLVWLGSAAGAGHWALWCVCASSISLSQPAVGLAFAPGLAGRALSAFNLVIFSGVFVIQWGIGLSIDALQLFGWSRSDAFRGAFALLGLIIAMAGVWFFMAGRALARPSASPGALADESAA